MSKKLKAAQTDYVPSAAEIESHGLTLQEYYWLQTNDCGHRLMGGRPAVEGYSASNDAMIHRLAAKGFLQSDHKPPSAAAVAKAKKKMKASLAKASKLVDYFEYDSPKWPKGWESNWEQYTAAKRLLTRPSREFRITDKGLRFFHELAGRKEAAPMNINANVKLVK